jgi:serine/threonine protein kinase
LDRIGQYVVRSVLGEGHFGTVYLGEGDIPGKGPRSSRHKLVAIKQLRGEWTMRGFETLVREFELLDRVKHRSLCRVYEFLDRDNAVVMEHVEGATLRQVLDAFAAARESIWADAALEIGCEIADCLYQAHATPGASGEAMLLVHRDIKPENIMLTPTGEVKVLDFGLARIDDGAREVGVKGTPLYMAPEQARGELVEHRTDLFGLGLVLFELITGSAAYPVPSRDRDSVIEELMGRIERADLSRELGRLSRSYPAIAQSIGRCLASSPAARPADGHALMIELRRCVQQRGALAEFAAYAFGSLGPLASRAAAAQLQEAPASLPPPRPPLRQVTPGRIGQPQADQRAVSNPRVNSLPPADMLSPLSEAPEHPTMSKPPESARPPGSPRPTAAARPRPTPTLKPPTRPTPQKMWTPESNALPPAPAIPPSSRAGGGELPMVPLNQDDDGGDLPKNGATAFFTVPTGPRKKEEPTDLRRSDPIAVAGGAGASIRPPGAVGLPPGVPPGGYVPMGAVPPSPLVPMAPIGISGPVAGGYGPPPSQVPPDFHGDGDRARSYRVFAVVAGLMFMVFSVTIVAVLLLASVVLFPGWTGEGEIATNGPPPIVQPVRDRDKKVDTGIPAAPELKPEPKVRPVPSGEPKPPKPKEPEVPKPGATGTVTITLGAGAPAFTSIEVSCDSGFKERAPFSGNTASLPNVPRASCRLSFKGGPFVTMPVQGGQTLTCSFNGTTPTCN